MQSADYVDRLTDVLMSTFVCVIVFEVFPIRDQRVREEILQIMNKYIHN